MNLTPMRGLVAATLLCTSLTANALSFSPLANQPESPVIQQIVSVSETRLVAIAAGGQMYANTGSGGAWQRFGASLGHQVVTLAYGGGVYYASTRTSSNIADSGIFASNDDGQTWRAFNSGLPTEFGTYNIGIGSLIADAGYVYVGANSSSNQGIYRSAHGDTAAWSLVHSLANASGLDAVLVKNGTSLCLWSSSTYRFGVEYSLDSGATWTKGSGYGYPATGDFSNNASPATVGGTAITLDGARLYANNIGNSRLYQSTDGCKTFTSTQPTAFSNVDTLTRLGVSLANVLYAAGASGKLLSSSDGGVTFSDASGVDYSAAEGRSIVQFARNGEGMVFGTNGDGLFSVTRGGFTRANDGYTQSQVDSLAARDGTTLLALLSGGGLHVLAEGLADAVAGNDGAIRSASRLLVVGASLYAINDNGVLRSSDGGDTWSAANTGLSGLPQSRAVGLTAVGGDLYIGIGANLFHSSDGAASWSLLSTFPSNSTINSLSYSSGALLARVSNFSLSLQGIYRSTDGGATFVLNNTGLPAQTSDIYPQLNQFYTQASGVYVQSSSTKLYRTTDGGANWAAFDIGNLPTSSFFITAFTEDARGTLYLSYAGPDGADLYFKTAAASGWTRSRTGLPPSTPRSSWGTAMLADATGLNLGVQGEGLYRSDLADASEPPPTQDTVPDAFVFADQNDVPVSTLVTSNEITISGIDAATGVIIGDVGEYSLNGGAFTRVAGSVVNGDRLRVRHTSSANAGESTLTVLTVGGIEGRFTSRTAASTSADTTPDPFDFGNVLDVELDTDTPSLPLNISGINVATAIHCSGCSYSVNGAAFTTADGFVSSGDVVTLRVHSSTQYSTTINSSVSIGTLSDGFAVRTKVQPVTTPSDGTPDAFTFAAQTGVEPGSVVTSAAVTISGFNTAVNISIVGGEYSINGAAFISGAAGLSPGDAVSVRHTASSAFLSDTVSTLTIGGVSGRFTSTTRDAVPTADTTPDAFAFGNVVGAAPNATVTSKSITISGINSATPVSVGGGQYSINDGAFTTADGVVNNGDRVSLRVLASSATNQTVTATLIVGGVSTSYSVTTAAVAPPPTGSTAIISDATGRAVTISSDIGRLTNVRLLTPPAGIPDGVRFATGLFAFDIEDIAPGATVHVSLQLPSGTVADAYYKYGPEGALPGDHYYRFDFDGSTGAVISGNTVTLTLVDNARGDGDATAGRISDPGAPASVLAVVTVDAHAGGGSFGGGLLATLLGFAALRRKRAAMAARAVLAIGAACGSVDAMAQQPASPWSLGVRGGAGSSELSAYKLETQLADRGHSVQAQVDRDAAAASIFAGYEFHRGLILEMSAGYLGRYDVKLDGVSAAPAKLVDDLADLAPASGWTTSLLLRTRAPLWAGSALFIDPRFGGFYRWNRISGDINGDHFSRSDRQAGVQIGLGVSYSITPRLSLGLGGDLYLSDAADLVAVYGAQIETRF
jgi:hypothetical protein